MTEGRILVVDDEAAQRDILAGFLRKQGYEVREAASGPAALDLLRTEPVDLVLTDVRMPGMSGLDLLREARALNYELPVVVLTAYGSITDAVTAMREGAVDYLSKPVDLDAVLHRVRKIFDGQRLVAENRALREALRGRYRLEGIVAHSGRMQEVLSLVHRVAGSTTTVLIQGESGTGKELIAQAIHYKSNRGSKPLVKVNCAALPESLLESELFGHVKGAFTGAVAERPGRFEAAHGGSIFLDEIGDVSPAVQVKLLRVLQEREFERVGSSQTLKVDVRVIAATNQDLSASMREKRFREDLYFRLNVVPILIPPLRERRADILPLLDHFLQKYAAENGKLIRGLEREARDVLLRYDYPGNIRELENLIERAVVLCRGEVIGLDDLPLVVQEKGVGPNPSPPPGSLPAELEALERRMIEDALDRAHGVQTRAAEHLGIGERALRYKLKKLGIKESAADTAGESP
ncbi:MAG TPA: sigma-54 dependent transcriptional regulator [Candidatus Methylomirabilis sp.]|nr:sigma-54 dependent transcriptional regulator [Candidatus Methylomirabilis sp.]